MRLVTQSAGADCSCTSLVTIAHLWLYSDSFRQLSLCVPRKLFVVEGKYIKNFTIVGARLTDCIGISRQNCLLPGAALPSTVVSPEAVSGGEDVGVGEQGASAPVPVVSALQHLQQKQGQGWLCGL